MDAYDTPSGDLKIGDYAQEADGSYVSKVPAYTYTDATSSVPIAVYLHVQNRPDCSNLPESADDRLACLNDLCLWTSIR